MPEFDGKTTPNLGPVGLYGGTQGLDKLAVDMTLKEAQYNKYPTCINCTSQAKYRLIPKHKEDNTAELQKGVYICEHCLKNSPYLAGKYGVKSLPKRGR